MRSFIALEFDNDLKRKLYSIQENLKKEIIKGSWVSYDNFHLTLKFLGNIDRETVVDIDKVLKNISENYNGIQLSLYKLGYFKGNKNIRVLWVGTKGDIKLLDSLNKDLENQMESLNFKKETRPFKPHITIARRVVFKENFHHIKEEIDYDFVLNKITLMKSEDIMGKRIYTPLKSYNLQKITTE